MIVYRAVRTKDGCCVYRTDSEEEGTHGRTKLKERQNLFNHSPDGFEWGYSGSGPAQLALALLADATGDDSLAVQLHQEFKAVFIAPANRDGFRISQTLILDWVRLRKEQP